MEGNNAGVTCSSLADDFVALILDLAVQKVNSVTKKALGYVLSAFDSKSLRNSSGIRELSVGRIN